jgi:hypothetical protein
MELPKYSDLLTFIKNQKINSHRNDDDDDNSSNQNIDDVTILQKEKSSSINRRFFLYDILRPKYGNRPSNSYGRKSHWDTFFG